MPLYVSIPVLFVFLILSAFFSSSETALTTVNHFRLKKEAEEGNKRAARAYALVKDYDHTISVVLFGNNVVNVGISSFMIAAVTVAGKGGLDDTAITLISIAISLTALLLLGEILPKQLGKLFNYQICLGSAGILKVLSYIFLPFTFVTSQLGKLFSLILIRKKKDEEEEVNVDEELTEMVETIEDEGIIDEKKAELVKSAIEFNNTEAYEIMKPRVDVMMFNIEDDVSELINNKEYFIYSRIPIYKEDKDNIIGILPMKLVQRKILTNSPIIIEELMYKPLFVPRSMMITDILQEFKETKHHIAIVLDEYGGVEGIITMEDIEEELVGPIFDETDIIEKEYSETKDGFIVDGSMNIDDFYNLVEIEPDFDDPSYNTVSGLVVDKLQRFAKVGDKVIFENVEIEVILLDEFTIEKVRVKLLPKENDED